MDESILKIHKHHVCGRIKEALTTTEPHFDTNCHCSYFISHSIFLSSTFHAPPSPSGHWCWHHESVGKDHCDSIITGIPILDYYHASGTATIPPLMSIWDCEMIEQIIKWSCLHFNHIFKENNVTNIFLLFWREGSKHDVIIWKMIPGHIIWC